MLKLKENKVADETSQNMNCEDLSQDQLLKDKQETKDQSKDHLPVVEGDKNGQASLPDADEPKAG